MAGKKNIISRKLFLKRLSILGVGVSPLIHMLNAAEKGIDIFGKGLGLIDDPRGILRLAPGLGYSVISEKGSVMSDGLSVPDHADGMAAFPLRGKRVALIRNHEIGHFSKIDKLLPLNPLLKQKKYLQKNSRRFYDSGDGNIPCCGGTTTIIYNPSSDTVEKEYLSLSGTLVNCSGGPTPWGTWITCEETVDRRGLGLSKDHGYNFEVLPTTRVALQKAVPIAGMGRFRHEAVAIDPASLNAYQTEDRDDGLIYRFVPSDGRRYLSGGRLQVLSISRLPDTRNWNGTAARPGLEYSASWLDIGGVDSPDDDLRNRGAEIGASVFARPEGMWHDSGYIYFTCTSGGQKKIGQIWRYSILEGTVELLFEPDNAEVMRKCDNITIAPWGDIIVCEDGRGQDRLIGIRTDGSSYTIAENILNSAEFAGACFSPDGGTLFVNIYRPTTTIAITGNINAIR